MRRGGLWVSCSAWREKGMMRKLCKNALRIFREIKERACVHCFWLAKPQSANRELSDNAVLCCHSIVISLNM